MIRARAHRARRRAWLLLPLIAAGVILAACVTGESSLTPGPGVSPATSAGSSGQDDPAGSPSGGPSPSETNGGEATLVPTTSPGAIGAGCSGNDKNRVFFQQAAASMAWPVYCAVLPDGWFLEAGRYRLADGGHLEVTYRGPADVHVAIVEGNVCAGADVEGCAPRDAVIGPAAFGTREGELGRLANGLVLDVDRGATPSWRATGLGLTEEAFRALCSAFLVVGS